MAGGCGAARGKRLLLSQFAPRVALYRALAKARERVAALTNRYCVALRTRRYDVRTRSREPERHDNSTR